MIDLAQVKPEYVTHMEVGVKTNPTRNSTLNLVLHNTDVTDYQTQIQTAEVGVNRGYLANAEEVRVICETGWQRRVSTNFSFYGAIAAGTTNLLP